MFTGLIQSVGRLLAREARGGDQRLRFGWGGLAHDDIALGESIAVNGCCLTVVAFDAEGNRLGMGGGYYDRTLACWHEHGLGPRPLGLAHDCQQVESVPQAQWDVPLPQIITPARCWRFS